MWVLLRNYIQYNGGLFAAAIKLMRVTRLLITRRGTGGIFQQWQETRQRMQQMERERLRGQALARHHVGRSLRILATSHTAYIARMLETQFGSFGIQCDIIIDTQHRPDADALYVVVCPQMFAHVPRHMIAFQMEQSTSERWFDRQYMQRLSQAIAVVDYSSVNLAYLQGRGIPVTQLYLYAIHPIANYRAWDELAAPTSAQASVARYDAVFYGDTQCERRKNMLDALSQRFRILIISELFGAALHAALRSAPVVLNIHYYDRSLLETTRLCECISLGIPVISERALDQEAHDTWNGWVRYVPTGDLNAMAAEIQRCIDQADWPAAPYCPSTQAQIATRFAAARLLIGCGLLDAAVARTLELPIALAADTPICLSLPETSARRALALANGRAPHFFDGLRHVAGWKGCAMSYSYLAAMAQMRALPWLEVYEDDCQFHPESLRTLDRARHYLRQQAGQWDVFSAMVTTIAPDTQVRKVEWVDGIQFVHINKTLGTVYSIFNHTVYAHLAAWDATNDDAASNTIDQYLASREGLRVITCLPYVVGHCEDAQSSLWGFGNQAYSHLITESQLQLTRLVAAFEATAQAPISP